MKRTVSCRFYNTGKILTNPTSFVTKGLNRLKMVPAVEEFLAYLDMGPGEKGERPTERPVSLSKNGG